MSMGLALELLVRAELRVARLITIIKTPPPLHISNAQALITPESSTYMNLKHQHNKGTSIRKEYPTSSSLSSVSQSFATVTPIA